MQLTSTQGQDCGNRVREGSLARRFHRTLHRRTKQHHLNPPIPSRSLRTRKYQSQNHKVAATLAFMKITASFRIRILPKKGRIPLEVGRLVNINLHHHPI